MLIASPGDTTDARTGVERSLHAWNGDRAERESVILLPRRWETDAVPRLGGPGQTIINEQLVDTADIVMALFGNRLGQATSAAVSGTVEEIRLAHAAGKPVHVWFSEEPIPRGADLQQVQAVKEYREALAAEGLYGSFTSPEDLAAKVRQAIENDLAGLDLGVAQRPPDVQSGALLRARHEHDREPHQDRRGRVTYRSRNHRPIVRNTGTASAAQVTLNLSAPEENGSPPFLHDPSPPPTILPGGEFAWPLMMTNNTSRQCRVTMTWQEGEEERSEVQDVSL